MLEFLSKFPKFTSTTCPPYFERFRQVTIDEVTSTNDANYDHFRTVSYLDRWTRSSGSDGTPLMQGGGLVLIIAIWGISPGNSAEISRRWGAPPTVADTSKSTVEHL